MIKYVLLCFSFVSLMNAVTIGHVDTFEDGSTEGWFVPGPHPSPPANIATGGPDGTGDHYLQLTAIGGGGPGSRMTVLNESQWQGSYSGAGITHITMDV